MRLCITVILWWLLQSVMVYGQDKTRPNVLFIVVDDLRPELGCYGNPIVKSPNIDRLAATGTVFLNAYCQQAVCAASRSSVLTGLRPNTTKVWGQKLHFRTTIPDVVTLPQYFKLHGYFSQCIGKIYHDPQWAQDSLSWSAPEILAITGRAGKYALPINNNRRGSEKANASESADVPDNRYIDGQVADAAVAFINEKRNQPFFLAVGFRRPHLPFSAPKKYWDMYDRNKIPLPENSKAPAGAPDFALHDWRELRGYRDIAKTGELDPEKTRELIHGYYAAISYTDAQIGRVLEALQRSGKYDNTLIVVWADHGFHLGEQQVWGKATNYELAACVPLLIKLPGVTKGHTTTSLVELVDLYPTLVDLCELPEAPNQEGISLKPLLNDPRIQLKDAAFSQYQRPINYKGLPRFMGYSIRTKRFRYIEWQDFQSGEIVAAELYDHEKDTGETTNLAGAAAYASVVDQLSRMVQNRIRK
jgi:Arylsulfatase A and related enzymes